MTTPKSSLSSHHFLIIVLSCANRFSSMVFVFSSTIDNISFVNPLILFIISSVSTTSSSKTSYAIN